MKAASPRIAPLTDAELTDEQLGRLEEISRDGGPPASNLYRTMMRHDRLFNRWMALNGSLLLRSSLDARHRELAILRVAFRSQCDYEWEQHVVIGKQAGLSASDVVRLQSDLSMEAGWEQDDFVVLQAVDELCTEMNISNDTWNQLSERYDEAGLLEFIALVGVYRGLALILKTVRVTPEAYC